MALAEARAIWQRTANRCLVQEDAKRAPKLACCPPVCPVIKPVYFNSVSAAGGQDIPTRGSQSYNPNPSHFNPFPSSKWWLQMPPNYGHPKGSLDDQQNSLEGNSETCQMHESSANLARNRFSTSYLHDPCKSEAKDSCEELKVEAGVGCEIPKKDKELSGSCWIEAEENTPWWRTADANELALLVAHMSLDCIENCDLPSPQNPHVKKDIDVNVCSFFHGGTSSSSLNPNLGYAYYKLGSVTAGNAHQKHNMPTEGWFTCNTEKPPRDIPGHESNPGMHALEKDACKAQLLEALCHSQTRAREAEAAAKQTHTEKEHVIKLVLRQASQLFAYKLWLQLLQMENFYLQLKNHKCNSVSMSVTLPVALPWTHRRTRKMRKRWQVSSSGRHPRQYYCPPCDVSKNAVVLAVGLGLVGAGFLLGWTAGWMLPTW